MIPVVKRGRVKKLWSDAVIVDIDRPLRADARRNRERILESARSRVRPVRGGRTDRRRRPPGGRRASAPSTATSRPKRRCWSSSCARSSGCSPCAAREALEAGRRAVRRARGPAAPQCGDGLKRRRGSARARGRRRADLDAGAGRAAGARRVTEELIARAREAGTIRQDVDANDIAMLMCGVCSTMGTKPGFDWRRHLELVIDALRAR